MLIFKNKSTGNNLDMIPGQEITFTLDNPMFTDDGLPVAVSTGIELALTPINKQECGFIEAMMLPPLIQTIPITIILAGVEIFIGEFQFDEFSDKALKYTFVGKSAIEAMEGKIHEIQCENYDGQSLPALTYAARSGALLDFGMPMIIRKAFVAKFEYWSGEIEPECSAADKYANWLYTSYPYVIPAVKVDYILNKIIPRILLPSEVVNYTKHLAILGTYKPETWRNGFDGLPGIMDNGIYLHEFNVADSLPDMSKVDFFSNLLKMFCATMFQDGENYCVLLNKDIFADESFVDWTENVAEIYSIVSGEADEYAVSYANNESQTFNPSKPDHPDGEADVSDGIQVCATYEAMLAQFRASKSYINVKMEGTGDIYSGKNITASLHPDIDIPIMDMVYQAGMEVDTIGNTSNDAKRHEVSIDFSCPKSIPANVTHTTPIGLDPLLLRGVSPVIDIPAMDNARSSEVYIGLLFYHNFFVQGNYFTPTSPHADPGTEKSDNTLSIAIGGERGLYKQFHKHFAEWYTKKKNPVKADVFLTPEKLANLRLWRKIMIYNRLFLIKTIEITVSNEMDIIFANAEFVEV